MELPQITTDKRTIWINGIDRLFARFCPSSQEYLKNPNTFSYDFKLHNNSKPTKADWQLFCKKVKERFNFDIPKKFIPNYII